MRKGGGDTKILRQAELTFHCQGSGLACGCLVIANTLEKKTSKEFELI